MKKTISILAILLMTAIFANAQDSTKHKFFQKVSGGMITGIFADGTFTGNIPPFKIGYGLLANVTIVTPVTYHNVMYAPINNSARMLNGKFLPNKWDTYIVYSKVLHNSEQYLGVGIEKMEEAEDVKYFLFFESGTDFKGTNSFTFGVLVSIQDVFWKR